jgi:phenylacetate-coenzyme A ligase PaaK-like adenylate-forming protein
MNFVERTDQFFVGRIAFPAVNYLLNRRDILGRCRKLLVTEHLPQEAVRELQFERLSAVLRHAYRWSPFYTRRFKEIGLAPGDIKTLEDVRRIPPLVRQDVVDHRRDMVDLRCREAVSAAEQASRAAGSPISFARFRRHKLIRRSSSGSTGTPTVVYEDGSTTSLNWVHELRLKHWFGLAPGAKEARMSVTSMEYAAKGKFSSAREWLWNQMTLPGYFLSEHEYELCLRKIRKFRPRVLWGPTPALTGLAQYARSARADTSACRPNLVISRAAPLYEPEKKLLMEVFGCPVTNIYGSKEVGHVSMICPQSSMHVNEENYLVETDTDGVTRESAGRGPGKILITPLFESPMPFLRYQIGDLAELGTNDCACGRSLGTLKKILGRIGEVFKTKEGHLIEPNFWCIAFEAGRLSQDVEKYQVVYRSNDRIRIRLVRRRGYSPETEADLRGFLARNMPASIQFEFEYVDDIKPQPSGKYLFVVNEIDQQEAQPVLG